MEKTTKYIQYYIPSNKNIELMVLQTKITY